MEKKIGTLSSEVYSRYEKDYREDGKNKIIRKAMSRTPIMWLLYDTGKAEDVKFAFNHEIKTMPVANQRASGRCWIFAGLNVLREYIGREHHVHRFELSQNYISMYDKIEKCNHMLEKFIELADKDHGDRTLDYLLTSPLNDGGQWDMFANLVKKYGLLPQNAFPETHQSNNTHNLSFLINNRLREFAYEAHKLYLEGKKDEIRPLKDKYMEGIYTAFTNAFGVPPKTFDFEYYDDKEVLHIDRGLTPLSFFQKYVGSRIDEYVSIINYPETDRPYMRNYTVEHLGNVVEGSPINHLNLPMERLKELVIKQLLDNEPVWFGSDVGFYRDREKGYFVWDSNLYDYESFFGFKPEFEKDAMLYYRASAMNHAMVITGVHLDEEEKPVRYKIENSWGEDVGKKGYFVMGKDFFDRFVYQVVVLKKYLSKEELEVSGKKPIVLPIWDPMGTLAD